MLETDVNNEDNHIPVIGRGESIAVKRIDAAPPEAATGDEETPQDTAADIELLQASKGWVFPKVKVGDA